MFYIYIITSYDPVRIYSSLYKLAVKFKLNYLNKHNGDNNTDLSKSKNNSGETRLPFDIIIKQSLASDLDRNFKLYIAFYRQKFKEKEKLKFLDELAILGSKLDFEFEAFVDTSIVDYSIFTKIKRWNDNFSKVNCKSKNKINGFSYFKFHNYFFDGNYNSAPFSKKLVVEAKLIDEFCNYEQISVNLYINLFSDKNGNHYYDISTTNRAKLSFLSTLEVSVSGSLREAIVQFEKLLQSGGYKFIDREFVINQIKK